MGSLGHFGGRETLVKRRAGSTGASASEAADSQRDGQIPSPEGMPASSQQVMVAMRGISHNLVFSSSDADTVAWATGTITLSDGAAYSITGGNTGNMIALTYIYLDIDASTTALQTSTTYSDAVGNNKYLIAVAQNATTAASYIVVSGSGGIGGELIITANMISNLIITAAQIANATITSGKTKIGLHSVSHNLVFSATDFNTVAWASGTVTNSAGTNYSITGSNTGNMAALTYIYLDTDVSTTALQTTTTYSTAVGDNKILLAVAEDAADSSSLAFFQVFDGIGGISVNAEHIANLSITAALISNLTITAAQIANLSLNSGKMTLSDDANFAQGILVNGSFESWTAGTAAAGTALTGTVAKTASSATLTGTSTLFLSELKVGDTIRVPGTANETAEVTAIASDTSLTVLSAFANTASGQTCTRLSVPDFWVGTGSGASFERVTGSGNVRHGLAAVQINNAASTAASIVQEYVVSATENTYLRGRTISYSCKVKCSTASRAQLRVDDGVDVTSSSNHSGGGSFETLTITHAVNASATQMKVECRISSGTAISAIFDGAMLVVSQTPVEFSHHPIDFFLRDRRSAASDSITRAASSMAVVDDMSIPFVAVNGAQSVEIIFTLGCTLTVAGQPIRFEVRRDSTVIGPPQGNNNVYTMTITNANTTYIQGFALVDTTPAAGVYTYDIRWSVDQSPSAATGGIAEREMTVRVSPGA